MHDAVDVVTSFTNDGDESLFFTGSKHQLMQTNVVLTALHSLNGCTIGAALGKVFTSVPRAIVCTCGISVIKVKGCRDGNNYLPPVFVLVCRASL